MQIKQDFFLSRILIGVKNPHQFWQIILKKICGFIYNTQGIFYSADFLWYIVVYEIMALSYEYIFGTDIAKFKHA